MPEADTTAPETRTYLPYDWVDEVVPGMLASPDAYLVKSDDGGWMLRLPKDDPEYENEFFAMKLEQGQIINWVLRETFGDLLLTVQADQSWTVDRPLPEKANTFWMPFDFDTVTGSIEELVTTCGDPLQGEPLVVGNHVINAFYWSPTFPMRFEVNQGVARFAPVVGQA
ncbi:hypothetical protein [Pelagibacterium montanilacus]|uniref:hypothetical protein n=1 Tax=Pelagibacterium montanilacus TaxID=2185280 RepID=UPI000F8F1450|nr:hypothetical protein [Pelagibacterium montanilacus]